VAAPAIDVTPDMDLHRLCVRHWPIHYLVCDEAQFYTVKQCDQLARVVDELEVEVYAFGLITDFRGHLFDGTRRLLEIADERVPLQVEARCWCGARATHNARVVNGEVTYEGETVVVGDTSRLPGEPLFGDAVRYELLCRRHFREGELGQ
jgi:thymidine kinase